MKLRRTLFERGVRVVAIVIAVIAVIATQSAYAHAAPAASELAAPAAAQVTSSTAQSTPLPATPAAAATGTGTAGTNVIGDDDSSSMGLFVSPWKDLPERDADHAPRLYGGPPATLDAAALKARIGLDEQIESQRLERLDEAR